MGAYYDTLKELQTKIISKALLPIKKFQGVMFKPDSYMRTDGLPVDKTIANLEKNIVEQSDPKEKAKLEALLERIESVSDLTENLYDRLNENPNTFSYWFPALLKSNRKCIRDGHTFFKIPASSCITLPLPLSQFMRIEYQNTNDESRKKFNEILLEKLNLDKNKHYFIKNGVFSGKFEWRNCHIVPSEQNQIGEYFQVVNNHAMLVGAGRTNDIVIREYIDDPEHRPTIYNGMPLRTEFRCFIDCDTKDLIQTVPYWNPLVMKKVLQSQGQQNKSIYKWYETYKWFEEVLNQDFNANIGRINKNIQYVINELSLKGRWSLDVMKSGNDFYLIDMAEMKSSALTELINPSRLNELKIKLEQ
ncbi:hypothetical protein [Liquorilactobacillus hordei]|uniref:Uncharacterized protein n=1 Tax=Liquorilactobacillus hordei DSM 19519 TaxID=1423759 RepID=A0A0R1MJ28_9LACO|nr:hypothetical protein [Liquorilactobacillus hordei]KRL07980.1 hypothetical protein FC92_GL001049 [Liquorilactobacillus hordei DSM 19519]QYH51076.1 hypothetical protein G6O70_00510 [Liquorilactobacillus hordei DSM 19519]